MSNTYIVVATENEIKLIKEASLVMPCPVIVTGVGATNVINALKDLPRDAWIINVGYAGSVDIPVGTMVRVGKSKLQHKVPYEEKEFVIDSGVTCYSGTDFVEKETKKGCVFDMELAFICALGFQNVRSFKFISDNCNYDEYEKNSK